MTVVLAVLFLVTAALYAAVGFGGGSTYNALLVLNDVDYRLLPSIALLCNIIVVAGGVHRLASIGAVSPRRLAPFVLASVPAAAIGGLAPISETAFVGLLGGALLIAGLQLAFERPTEDRATPPAATRPLLAAGVGGGIGLLSGLVGIGGGIFLAPILYAMKWDAPRAIAGACSVFILVNSVAGLAGQLVKLGDLRALGALSAYWMAFPAVLIGGQIGSRLVSVGLAPTIIKRLTAVLILFVAARLLFRWASAIA